MELWVLLASSGLGVFFLVYFFTLKKQSVVSTAEVKKLRENEKYLRMELEELQHKWQHAIEDPVTHLLGWRLFEDRLNQAIKESARYQFTMSVLFVDIDEFRVINAGLGHEVGNALLLEVANRLQGCIRQVDSISRQNKDTFVILLTQLSKPETAAVVAQRILSALAEPFQIEEHELYITVCVGIAIYPADSQDKSSLLRRADEALRVAKGSGRHGYQFYQEKMDNDSHRELILHNSLRRDTVVREFVLYYQPIINMQNDAIFCMEALLHWQHSQLGLIGPEEVFNYADKQRKLNFISEWLLQNACRQFLEWRSQGFTPEHLAIPISVRQLESSQFIYRISQILQEVEFNPAWLLLEIREMQQPLSVLGLEKAFNMLRYLGVKLAIDQFGAGSFSLLDLCQLPVDYLKLDPACIEDVTQEKLTTHLLESVMFMANKLSMQLIVPGIASEQQLAIVKKIPCHLLQGELISAKLSGSEVEEKLIPVR